MNRTHNFDLGHSSSTRRGHRFVRYADDCNIYVRSERAGQRVMKSISRFITQKLKLKVNEAKSAVARPLTIACQRSDKLGERQQTKGVDRQRFAS